MHFVSSPGPNSVAYTRNGWTPVTALDQADAAFITRGRYREEISDLAARFNMLRYADLQGGAGWNAGPGADAGWYRGGGWRGAAWHGWR